MSVRDAVSSAIFYAGVAIICSLLIRTGTTYSWQKVDDEFTLMDPRIKRGSHVWVNKRIRRPGELAYEDIIMFEPPLGRERRFPREFARVIGKPGDVVELQGDELYRAERQDGELAPKQRITEHYVKTHRRRISVPELMVPRNCVFVLFDDRGERMDPRHLIVPTRAIRGKVID
jgi:signal peptidase I